MSTTDGAVLGSRQTEEVGNYQMTAASQLRGYIVQAAFHFYILKAFAKENAVVFVRGLKVFVGAFEDSGPLAEKGSRLAIQEGAWAYAINFLPTRDQ